jgi:hypothetical protein
MSEETEEAAQIRRYEEIVLRTSSPAGSHPANTPSPRNGNRSDACGPLPSKDPRPGTSGRVRTNNPNPKDTKLWAKLIDSYPQAPSPRVSTGEPTKNGMGQMTIQSVRVDGGVSSSGVRGAVDEAEAAAASHQHRFGAMPIRRLLSARQVTRKRSPTTKDSEANRIAQPHSSKIIHPAAEEKRVVATLPSPRASGSFGQPEDGAEPPSTPPVPGFRPVLEVLKELEDFKAGRVGVSQNITRINNVTDMYPIVKNVGGTEAHTREDGDQTLTASQLAKIGPVTKKLLGSEGLAVNGEQPILSSGKPSGVISVGEARILLDAVATRFRQLLIAQQQQYGAVIQRLEEDLFNARSTLEKASRNPLFAAAVRAAESEGKGADSKKGKASGEPPEVGLSFSKGKGVHAIQMLEDQFERIATKHQEALRKQNLGIQAKDDIVAELAKRLEAVWFPLDSTEEDKEQMQKAARGEGGALCQEIDDLCSRIDEILEVHKRAPTHSRPSPTAAASDVHQHLMSNSSLIPITSFSGRPGAHAPSPSAAADRRKSLKYVPSRPGVGGLGSAPPRTNSMNTAATHQPTSEVAAARPPALPPKRRVSSPIAPFEPLAAADGQEDAFPTAKDFSFSGPAGKGNPQPDPSPHQAEPEQDASTPHDEPGAGMFLPVAAFRSPVGSPRAADVKVTRALVDAHTTLDDAAPAPTPAAEGRLARTSTDVATQTPPAPTQQRTSLLRLESPGSQGAAEGTGGTTTERGVRRRSQGSTSQRSGGSKSFSPIPNSGPQVGPQRGSGSVIASPVEEAQPPPLGVQLGTAPRHSGSLSGTPTGDLVTVGSMGVGVERSAEQARLSLTPIGIPDHLRFAAVQTDDDVIITKKSSIPRKQTTATQYDAIQFQLFLHDEAMFGAAASFDAGSSRRDSLILPSPSRNFAACQQATTLLPSLHLLADAAPGARLSGGGGNVSTRSSLVAFVNDPSSSGQPTPIPVSTSAAFGLSSPSHAGIGSSAPAPQRRESLSLSTPAAFIASTGSDGSPAQLNSTTRPGVAAGTGTHGRSPPVDHTSSAGGRSISPQSIDDAASVASIAFSVSKSHRASISGGARRASLGVGVASPQPMRKKRVVLRDEETQCVADGEHSYLELLSRESAIYEAYAAFHKTKLALSSAADNLTLYTDGYSNDVICPACDRVFVEPSLLWPCGHTFCRGCIEKTMRKGEIYVCSECHGASREGFTDNILIDGLTRRWAFRKHSVREPTHIMADLSVLLSRIGFVSTQSPAKPVAATRQPSDDSPTPVDDFEEGDE